METDSESAKKSEESIATRRSTRRSIIPSSSQDSKTSCKVKNKNNNNDQRDIINKDFENVTQINTIKTNKKSTNNQANKQETDKEIIREEIKFEKKSASNKNETNTKNQTENSSNIQWKESMLMEARDSAGKWYKSRIVDVDLDENKVLVHFLGWNSRYDQWFSSDSNDLRVVSDKSNQEEDNQKRLDDIDVNFVKIDVGTQVLAKWNDESYYPANLTRHLTKNGIFCYQVKFYDGVKKIVRSSNVKIMTKEDAEFFNVEYKPRNENSNQENQSDQKEIESEQIDCKNLKVKDQRHAEAELLLAIQEPKLIIKPNEDEKNNQENESCDKKIEIPSDIVKIEDSSSKENKLKDEDTKDKQQSSTQIDLIPSDSVRKSLRVKKLRKFTKEFVFDSPASIIAYNLASVSDPLKLVTDTPTAPVLANSQQNKKRKHESSSAVIERGIETLDDTNLDDSVFEPTSEKDVQPTTSKKPREENTKFIQNYFKSLKLFKSNKKQLKLNSQNEIVKDESNSSFQENDESSKVTVQNTDPITWINIERSKSGRIRISSKRKQEYEEEKAEEKKAREVKRRLKLKLKKQKETTNSKTTENTSSKTDKASKRLKKLKKKMEKKKLKKDKKKLLKKLIESSQQQLKQQQELIEKQLKKHEHKKSQKKLQKILKQQQLQLQLQIQNQLQFQQQQIQSPNFNMFFPSTQKPTITQQQILNNIFLNGSQLFQNSRLSQTNSPTSISSESLQCHFEDCKKKFRKHSLLEYHLKYHHYALQQTPASPNNQGISRNKRTSRQESTLNEDSNENYSYYDGDDPYEVIHCKCGNNSSDGFMIQCEICLCWQHGDCMNIKSTKQTPKNYLCWICREPTNKLKQLKYQNWMSELKNKDLCISEPCFKLDSNKKNNIDTGKLKLLNECSKKYYNLNLLMYTLEYQISLLNQITQENESNSLFNQDVDLISTDSITNEETIDQVEKLLHNISHLQNCLNKKFEEFNSKIDEFESKYKCDDDNLISRNFNLEELYNQLQSLINRDESNN